MRAALLVVLAAGLLGAGTTTRAPAKGAAAKPAGKTTPAKGPESTPTAPPPTPAAAPADAPVATGANAAVNGEAPRLTSGKGHSATGETRCAACHVTASWTQVRFDHDRTGFPLTGVHQSTSCKNCHGADFDHPVPRTCVGCHKDAHAGDLGARCEGCHDTATWASQFSADAHRRTAFPLIGAHAALPCVECHGQVRETRFARPVVDCAACHQADLQRTQMTSLDHAALGFSGGCQQCHGAWRFSPASFPGHDRCFVISSGAHAGIACLNCHSTLSAGAGMPGTCNTGTAACSSCHEHACSGPGGTTHTDQLHAKVLGYQCADKKCVSCHPPVPTP